MTVIIAINMKCLRSLDPQCFQLYWVYLIHYSTAKLLQKKHCIRFGNGDGGGSKPVVQQKGDLESYRRTRYLCL